MDVYTGRARRAVRQAGEPGTRRQQQRDRKSSRTLYRWANADLCAGRNWLAGFMDFHADLTSEPFGQPVSMETVNSRENDQYPELSDNGRTLMFNSDRDGQKSLWISKRSAHGESFAQPEKLDGAISGSISSDGRTIIFTSAGPGGQGNFDLWMATRTAVGEPFGEPVNLGARINSPTIDSSACLSGDDRTLFFDSQQSGGQGDFDLWMARIRLPEDAPPPAVAPFDAAAAKAHQEAWSKYIGQPVVTTNSIGMKLAIIPPGEFQMAGGDGGPVGVTLSTPFRLGIHEVTQGQWKTVMGYKPWNYAEENFIEGENVAASSVNWTEATEFCRKLNDRERAAGTLRAGWEYRLPTEAEW